MFVIVMTHVLVFVITITNKVVFFSLLSFTCCLLLVPVFYLYFPEISRYQMSNICAHCEFKNLGTSIFSSWNQERKNTATI